MGRETAGGEGNSWWGGRPQDSQEGLRGQTDSTDMTVEGHVVVVWVGAIEFILHICAHVCKCSVYFNYLP